MSPRVAVLLLALGLVVAGCSRESGRVASPFGSPPQAPDGPLAPATKQALDRLFADLRFGVGRTAVETIGASGDARLAWIVSDVLRLVQLGSEADDLVAAFGRLTGVTLGADDLAQGPWKAVTDRLIAWELPAPPDYVRYKAASLTLVEPRWEPFFADAEADIDWRIVSWGGVLIDDRPLGDPNPCPQGCIPALDDPAVTDAAGGRWYPDDAIVFGVVVGGEARAYPKNITFTGRAVSGPLREAGVRLDQVTVVTSTWGAWKKAHPATTAARSSRSGASIPGCPCRSRSSA